MHFGNMLQPSLTPPIHGRLRTGNKDYGQKKMRISCQLQTVVRSRSFFGETRQPDEACEEATRGRIPKIDSSIPSTPKREDLPFTFGIHWFGLSR